MSWKSRALGSVANKVVGLYELGLRLMQKLLRAYRVRIYERPEPSRGASLVAQQ